MTKVHFLCIYLHMHQCNKQVFHLSISECMVVSQLFCRIQCLSFMTYLSWSLQFIWFLPGGDFCFSVIEVCSAIRSLVFCPWRFVLLKKAYQPTLQFLSGETTSWILLKLDISSYTTQKYCITNMYRCT